MVCSVDPVPGRDKLFAAAEAAQLPPRCCHRFVNARFLAMLIKVALFRECWTPLQVPLKEEAFSIYSTVRRDGTLAVYRYCIAT